MTAQPTTSGATDATPDDAPTTRPRRGARALRLAGQLLAAVLVLGVAAVTLVLDAQVLRRDLPAWAVVDPAWPPVVLGLSLAVPGGLLLRRLPRHPVAWVMAGYGSAWLLNGLAGAWIRVVVFLRPDLPGGTAAEWVYDRLGPTLVLGLALLLLLFPDGHLPRERPDRAIARACLVGASFLPIALLLVPTAVADAFHGEAPPPEIAALRTDALTLPLPAGVWAAVLTVAYALLPLGVVGPIAVVALRYLRARGERRQQLRWLVWAGLVSLLAGAAGFTLPAPIPYAALGLAVVTTSMAVVVAVARYRLYDVDRLLPTTVVALLLAALVLVVDLVVLLVAGAAFGDRDSALIAIAVVAVLYTPLRARLWRAARRLTRGSRDDPYAAVSTLAGRLETAVAPGEQLAVLARSVAEAFKLPYVRVEIDRADGARAVVEHGHTDSPTVELPIRYRDESIGRVVVAEGRRLSDADQRLLGDLLRQAAGAARAGALSASLQSAREGLVTAREEERRRLRRDLHDSLGPGLGAVTLRIETARGLAARDPERADAVLEQAVADVGALLTDVRRLVHDLRPPALDELGLLGALRTQARRLSTEELTISVDGEPGELADLTAACEVAAFRIASEALTNVVRHAAATQARVTLERSRDQGDRLVVTVTDDGRGIGADVVAGVGTLSLRERAAELGGRTTVTCPPGGGTVVTAELPCAATPEEGDT
ncbi:MAG TPA: histidine kinase [Actinomycetospora sp.]|nr:histidine kinase [Actinomycetospora sp.]